MDPPEQALVQVGAAPLAAPSAAVAASIAANTKRTYAAAVKFRFRLQGLASPAGPKAIQGAGCRSTPSVESSAAARPLPASRAGCPVTVSGLAARNRWPPAGPRLSRCRRRAGGSHRRCRATMHGASWQHGAPSLASATVADKAGVDHTTIFPAEGG